MDYKEKYEAALKAAKEGKSIEEIFPEIAESEDEKIRKELIEFIKEGKGYCCPSSEKRQKWAHWLEKRGEQKHIEQDTETYDLWVYIREWNDKFGRLPKDEDELASCVDYVIKRQKPVEHKPVEYSKEDEKTKTLCSACVGYSYHDGMLTRSEYEEAGSWLESLKDRIQPQSNQEWSEKDEARFKNLCSIIDDSKWNKASKDGFKNWLLSIKHKRHWKPSNLEIESLNIAIGNQICQDIKKNLEQLLYNLKKL